MKCHRKWFCGMAEGWFFYFSIEIFRANVKMIGARITQNYVRLVNVLFGNISMHEDVCRLHYQLRRIKFYLLINVS